MEHDGEAGQLFHDGVEHVESQRRRNQTTGLRVAGALFGSKLIGSVRRTNRDSQRVDTRFRHKVDHLFGLRIVRFSCYDVVFYAGQNTQFAFYGYIKLMGIVYHFLRQSHILVVGKRRTVDHHRRETCIDTALASLEAVSMVEVNHNFGMVAAQFLCVLYSAL